MRPPFPSEPERSIGARDLTLWRTPAGRWLQRGFDALARRLRNAELAALLLIVLAGGLAVGATWLAGEIYEAVLTDTGVAQVDQPVLDWMVGVRTPELTAATAAFSATGGTLWMVPITAVVVGAICLRWRRWTPLVLMAIAVAGSLPMTVVGKRLVGRTRPPLELSIPPPETSPSFPSGHSLNSLVITGIVVYLLLAHLARRLARVATVTIGVLYAGAMGMSRVYLGHHWLTDVLAAWCLGIAWLTVVITCHRLWLTQHRDHELGRPRSALV
ncbi:phosphatase PAP2 family protein [Micropruina sp.]|uniref:phosphatase PAP2 family protein n=1 Tax=Micropruina sp. TaxID=2737536 RepID=UPI0039E26709